jgi:hypothetical protein
MTTIRPNVNGTTDLAAAAAASLTPPGGTRPPTVTATPHRRRARGFLAAAGLLASLIGGPAMPMVAPVAAVWAGVVTLQEEAPVADFEVIWEGQLSISRTPAQDSQWQWLLAFGVTSIANLDERTVDVLQFGFGSFLSVPPGTGTGGVPTNEDAERFLAFIQMADNQPVNVSSISRDRRATMVALLRYAIDGWTIDQALAEGQRLAGGTGGLTPHEIGWLLAWAATHPPGSHRVGVASTLSSMMSGTTSLVDSTRSRVVDFEVIWDGQLSTSRTPAHASQWQWLRARGVTSIVNLDDRVLDVGQYGFETFLWVPPAAAGVPALEDAERFLAFIQLTDNQPVHMVSLHRNRRATMVELLRYAIQGWTIEQALAEAERPDGGPGLTPHQLEWLLDWARSHPPGSHRRLAS